MNDTDVTAALLAIADELRSVAANGLHYSTGHYDRDRYAKVRDLAARTMALADTRAVDEIARVFRDDLGLHTPKASADAAIFDSDGRLLLTQRADCGQWCTPGGAADVGESPSEAAVRETWEETGLRVAAVRLLGLYDNRRLHRQDPGDDAPSAQTYNTVFAAEVRGGELGLTSETVDFDWFTEARARELSLFRGHRIKVFDVFAIHRGDLEAPIFH